MIKKLEKVTSNKDIDYCFLGIDDKLPFLQSFCKSENLSLNELAYIGDDTSDIEILKNVGIPFAVISLG